VNLITISEFFLPLHQKLSDLQPPRALPTDFTRSLERGSEVSVEISDWIDAASKRPLPPGGTPQSRLASRPAHHAQLTGLGGLGDLVSPAAGASRLLQSIEEFIL
jgi:hypothetical protein